MIVRLAGNPKDSVTVGTAPTLSVFGYQIAPKTTEAMMAHQAYKAQYEDAPPAEPSRGAVQKPTPVGSGVKRPA